MANENNYNQVVNLGLKCFEIKEGQKGVTLNCAFNGKKRPDGTYPKSTPIRVFCNFDTCDIKQDNYNNSYVSVDGILGMNDWQDQNGQWHTSLQIYASRVVKRVFDNQGNGRTPSNNNWGSRSNGNGNYNNNNNNYPQQGNNYPQNNGQNSYNNQGGGNPIDNNEGVPFFQ